MKKETKTKIYNILRATIISVTVIFGAFCTKNVTATSLNPNVNISKEAKWQDIDEGVGKITLTETETMGEEIELADYLIIYDVSGSMPIVTANGYEKGTYNINPWDIVNIGCKNPNHYSVLRPGAEDTLENHRNALHYDNNGTPDDTSDDILLNYKARVYDKLNWRGDKVQTFYLSDEKEFMYSKDKGCYSTSDTSQEMLNKFIDKVEEYDNNSRFAYISFAGDVVASSSFTTGDIVKEYINNATQYGGTSYVPPLKKADEILDSYTGDKPVKVIFITDGENYEEVGAIDTANKLKEDHPNIEIYAVCADYKATDEDDIKKIGDKYIYVDSTNVDETVTSFVNYSLNKKEIKIENKVLSDRVSEYFDILNTEEYPLPSDTSLNGDTITWNIPNNDSEENKTYTTSFYIKLKDEYRKNAENRYYNTNLDTKESLGAKLSYTISGGENSGESRTLYKETASLPYGLKTINVKKEWQDYGNKYETRPENITVNLLKNGTAVATKTLSDSATFEGYNEDGNTLKVYSVLYDNDSKLREDEYKIEEKDTPNYNSAYRGTQESGYIITNSLNMKSELEIRYVDTEGKEIADTKYYTGVVGQRYVTTPLNIYGYQLTEFPENAEGTYTKEKTVVTYVYQNLSTSLVIEHIYKKNGTVLLSEKVFGLIGDEVNTESKQIDGYTLIEKPQTETFYLEKDVIYVRYYYAKLNHLVTKYVDEVTGENIIEPVSEEVVEDDAYSTEKKTFDGYTYVSDTKNTSGTVKDKDIEVTYYYRKNTSGIDVKYIDEVTRDEIKDSYHIDGLEGEDYETKEEKIEGYECTKIPDNAKGKFKLKNSDVVYEYRKLSKLTVHHIDVDTEENIAPDTVTEYKEGEEYSAFPELIENYELYESPKTTTGKMGREDLELTFKYKRISAGLIVKYVDEISEEVLDEDSFDGKVGDIIELVEKEFTGYKLSSRPKEKNVTLKVEPIEKVFYYKKEKKITVKGVVEQTGETLYEETLDGLEGDPYETEPKEKEGYDLVEEPKNKDGVFGEEDDVIYVYSKIAGDLTVKYIDKDTSKLLDSYTISGHVDDEYETIRKDFEKYNYLYVVGKEKGTLKDEEQEVDYYYERKKGKLRVVYEYKDGTVVKEEEMEGYVGDKFSVEEEQFEDYVIVERPEKTEGEYVEGTTELKYLLDDPRGKIVVNFKDTDGNPLAPSIYAEDYVGVDFHTEAPDIDGYTILSDRVVDRKYEKGEIVIDIIYEKNKEPEEEKPNIPDEPTNPDDDGFTFEPQEVVPNGAQTPNNNNSSSNEENNDNENQEIATNPNTADVNIVIYLVAFALWVAVFVKGLIKKTEKEPKVTIK